jgi:cell division protein FtsB
MSQVLKYFTSIWIALLFYAVTSFLFGAVGIFTYKQLNDEREIQIANLKKIQEINEKLTGRRDALAYDADTITVFARELGFGNTNEHFMRIVGLKDISKQQSETGNIIRLKEIEYVDDKTIRIISIAIAISLLICIGIVDLLQFVKNT